MNLNQADEEMHPMGEAYGRFFEPTSDLSIKRRRADPRITSDADADAILGRVRRLRPSEMAPG